MARSGRYLTPLQGRRQGANTVIIWDINPDEMAGDGGGGLGAAERCTLAATALAQLLHDFASLPPTEAAKPAVRCYWLWYPGGLQHKHVKECMRVLTDSLQPAGIVPEFFVELP